MSTTSNNPTRSGSPLSVTHDTSTRLSLNEVESLSTKAARGAGMSWGLAEEAGYASRWLVSRGFDGVSLLAWHLRSIRGKSWQEICPVVKPGEWRTMTIGQPLCPIALGATISDHLGADGTPLNGSGLRVGELNSPALILPFLAMAAGALQQTISVCHGHDFVRIFADESIAGDISTLFVANCATLVISVDQHSAHNDSKVHANRTAPAAIDSDAAAFLHELAMQTTVPSSAGSRTHAGAPGSDND